MDMNRKSVIPIIFMCTGFALAKTFYGDVGILRAAVIGGISGIIGTAINQLIDKIILKSNKEKSSDINTNTDIEGNTTVKKDDSIMTLPQKIILAFGAVVFIIIVGIAPVQYDMQGTMRLEYNPNRNVYHYVDFYATSLRGIAVLGATAALWAIAGKKKTN